MKDFPSNKTSPAEQRFWTSIKTFFTLLEEDEKMHWTDTACMLAIGVTILWVVLLFVMTT